MTHVPLIFLSRGGIEERLEGRGCRPHEPPASLIIVMMAGIAEIGEAGLAEGMGEVGGHVSAIREASDLVGKGPASLDELEGVLGTEQGLTSSRDYQASRPAIAGEGVVRLDIEALPVEPVVAKRADRGPGEAERASEVACDTDREHTAGQEPASHPVKVGRVVDE